MINTCKLLFQKISKNFKGLKEKASESVRKVNKGLVGIAAGFMVVMLVFAGVFLFNTEADNVDKVAVDNVLQEENLFALNIDDNVKDELITGFSSLYSTVYEGHADNLYINLKDNFLPFGVEVYEVLSNKKEKSATIEDNNNELVMAENSAAEEAKEPETEAPTQPSTEAPTEAPTETPAEPETEAPTEQYTEVVEEVADYNPIVASYSGPGITLTADDYYWLLQIVEAEAGNQDDIGKILVANVILNRVYSGSFPGTVSEVIFQSSGSVYQFQPVKNGMIYSVIPSESTTSCVDRALGGEDYSQGALYFAMQTSSGSWFNTSLTFLFVHGAHYFYR